MPRRTKEFPAKRADYTFGHLVRWHLFEYGTRPDGEPSAEIGRTWKMKAICEKLQRTDRTIRDWMNNEHLPDDIVDLSMALFGNSPRWNGARIELEEALQKAKRIRDGLEAPGSVPEGAAPDIETDIADSVLPSGSIVPEGGEPAEASPPEPSEPEISGNDREDRPSSGTFETQKPRALYRDQKPPRRAPMRVIAAGIAVLLGIYGWMQLTRNDERSGSPRPSVQPAPSATLSTPTPSAAPPQRQASAPPLPPAESSASQAPVPSPIPAAPSVPTVTETKPPLSTEPPTVEPQWQPARLEPPEKALACVVAKPDLRELFAAQLRRTMPGRIETGGCSPAPGTTIITMSGIPTTPRAGADCNTPDKHVYEIDFSVARAGEEHEFSLSVFGDRCSSRDRDTDTAMEAEARNDAVLKAVRATRQILQKWAEH